MSRLQILTRSSIKAGLAVVILLLALLVAGHVHLARAQNPTQPTFAVEIFLDEAGLAHACSVAYRSQTEIEVSIDSLEVTAEPDRDEDGCLVTLEAQVLLPGRLADFALVGDRQLTKLEVSAQGTAATIELTASVPHDASDPFTRYRPQFYFQVTSD